MFDLPRNYSIEGYHGCADIAAVVVRANADASLQPLSIDHYLSEKWFSQVVE
jgi:hypothetical protein